MIVSHKHKFIFVKTHKTATQTFLKFIKPHLGPDDVMAGDPEERAATTQEIINENTQINIDKKFPTGLCARDFQEKYGNHLPWFVIKEITGDDIWNTYTKFTIERNPKDRILSLFYFTNVLMTKNNSLLNPAIKEKYKNNNDIETFIEKYINGENSQASCLTRYPEAVREYFEDWLLVQLLTDPQPITQLKSYGSDCWQDEINSYMKTARDFNKKKFIKQSNPETLFTLPPNNFSKFMYVDDEDYGIEQTYYSTGKHLTGQCRFLNYGNYYDGHELKVDEIVNFDGVGDNIGSFFDKYNIHIKCNKSLFDQATQNAHYRRSISNKKPVDWWYSGSRSEWVNKMINKRFYNDQHGEKFINLKHFNI